MNKKKLIFPCIVIIFCLIFLSSGCIFLKGLGPVYTLKADIYDPSYSTTLRGYVSPNCNVEEFKFVYDTKSHTSWEDYPYSITVDGAVFLNFYMYESHYFMPDTWYHYRAVAYCTDLSGIYRGWSDGWYAGKNVQFAPRIPIP